MIGPTFPVATTKEGVLYSLRYSAKRSDGALIIRNAPFSATGDEHARTEGDKMARGLEKANGLTEVWYEVWTNTRFRPRCVVDTVKLQPLAH